MTTEEDMKIEIRKIIKKYNGIRHTRLLDIIDKIPESCAKKTAEKYLKELDEAGKIHVVKEGRRKKTYYLGENNVNQKLKEDFTNLISKIKKEFDEIEKEFSKCSGDLQLAIYGTYSNVPHYNAQAIKQIRIDEEKENIGIEYRDKGHELMGEIIKLLNDLKLYDSMSEISNRGSGLDLIDKTITKISELKKDQRFKKISKERDIIDDGIEKLRLELERIYSQMESTITSLNHLKKSDEPPFELDEKIIKLQVIKQYILSKFQSNVEDLQKHISKLKTEEKQENKKLKEIDVQSMTIKTSLEKIDEEMEKLKKDIISDKLNEDANQQISKLCKYMKNMKLTLDKVEIHCHGTK